MPATRSTTGYNTLRLNYHPGSAGSHPEIKKPFTRIAASPAQLVVLNALYDTSCSRLLTKGDFLQASATTDLAEKWIRKWVMRQNKSRTKPKQLTAASKYPVPEASMDQLSYPSADMSHDIPMLAFAPPVCGYTTSGTSSLSMFDLLTGASSRRPDVTRSQSAPELLGRSQHPLTGQPMSHYDLDYTRHLTQSPSLGSISMASLSSVSDTQKDLSLSPAPSSLSSSSSPSLPLSTSRSPPAAVPHLGLASMAETPSMDASKAFPSLFSLLLDASTPQPQQNFDSGRHNSVQTDTAQSAFLSSLGFESELSSFEPSMQSHYPVADCPSMQLRARPLLSQPMFFHSLPVSYQVRLSDLTLLSKKIRATSLQDILAPAQASNKEGTSAAVSSLACTATNTAVASSVTEDSIDKPDNPHSEGFSSLLPAEMMAKEEGHDPSEKLQE